MKKSFSDPSIRLIKFNGAILTSVGVEWNDEWGSEWVPNEN